MIFFNHRCSALLIIGFNFIKNYYLSLTKGIASLEFIACCLLIYKSIKTRSSTKTKSVSTLWTSFSRWLPNDRILPNHFNHFERWTLEYLFFRVVLYICVFFYALRMRLEGFLLFLSFCCKQIYFWSFSVLMFVFTSYF